MLCADRALVVLEPLTDARSCDVRAHVRVYACTHIRAYRLDPFVLPPPPPQSTCANANVYESHPLFGCLLILETSAADDPARNLFLANMLRRLIFHFGTPPLSFSDVRFPLRVRFIFLSPCYFFFVVITIICRPVLVKNNPLSAPRRE